MIPRTLYESKGTPNRRFRAVPTGFLLLFLVAGLVATLPAVSAQEVDAGAASAEQAAAPPPRPGGRQSACDGGPTIDGIQLDECYVESLAVGGVSKTITVWYTKQQVPVTRVIEGQEVTLNHWLDSDAQAQQVAAWGRQAWEQYYSMFHRSPFEGDCDDVTVQMEDGIRGYACLPGDCGCAPDCGCWIHLGSAFARNGGDPLGTFHEFGHTVQYSYDNCLIAQNAGWPEDAWFVEGYACIDADAVDAVQDAQYFGNFVATYDPSVTFFDHDGNNVANKYYLEQVGSQWSLDPQRYHMDAVRAHYEQCETEGSLFVLDTLIPQMAGLSQEQLFLKFFAANWAKDWADPSTQPELVYVDDDTVSYGQVPLAHDVSMPSGSQSWVAETTPDNWAATYYQFRPQTGCDFVAVAVEGAPGAHLGINLMAADTSGATRVERAAWIGESLHRTFPGAGVYDRLVAIVNAFDYLEHYDVEFLCVSPEVKLLEPRPAPNATLVGEPASPVAFLARFQATYGGTPVMGLPESLFSADAEGDAVAFVPGSFQQVGEEYWAIMLPPEEPVGTTYVDMRLCLKGANCDTNLDSLLYVPRLNSDLALVFDASGSMAVEDVAGEGTRVDNAKKAGNVVAGLLQNGDRVLVMDFSALDSPPNCGMPFGDGDCVLDLQTKLERTDVTVPGTIDAARDAIDLISARGWTPIGAALREATEKLQASPSSANPKAIVLLSDGEENVLPLFEDVKSQILDSGTIVNTVGFGLPGEVGEAKLAQIAAETGGTFRFVSTTQGTMSAIAAEELDALRQSGVSEEIVARVAATWQPGPLALDDVYDYFDTQAEGARRLFSVVQVAIPDLTWREVVQYVDDSTGQLRFVVAAKQPEDGTTAFRAVSVLPPGADPGKGWIEISPPQSDLPPTWDVRNSAYDDAVIIRNPKPGEWKLRARYHQTSSLPADWIMMASAHSDTTLQGRFLAPIVDNQGHAGDTVPIVATLLDRKGAVPGATVVAAVEKPSGGAARVLYDDGQHFDGGAGDGIYGGLYAPTNAGGAYNVRILAAWDDPLNPGNSLNAEWLGSFYIDFPASEDADGDGMPDAWEQRCSLDPKLNDAKEDLDRDGLTNLDELRWGTLPCKADTDHGGENDKSEVYGKRDPLDPVDDVVRRLPHLSVRGLNRMIRIDWAHPEMYDSMRVFVSTDPAQLGSPVDMGSSGTYRLLGTTNDQAHYLTFQALGSSAEGGFSDPISATPKADPDPPSGYLIINGGRRTTASTRVRLSILATDDPPTGGVDAVGSPTLNSNAVSGVVGIKISNSPFLAGAAWEPMTFEKDWTLGECDTDRCVVYAQFRDAAGNESLVISDDIRVIGPIYLPLVTRRAP